jgi:hypothetical protein
MARKAGIEVPALCMIEAPPQALALSRLQVFSKLTGFEKTWRDGGMPRETGDDPRQGGRWRVGIEIIAYQEACPSGFRP